MKLKTLLIVIVLCVFIFIVTALLKGFIALRIYSNPLRKCSNVLYDQSIVSEKCTVHNTPIVPKKSTASYKKQRVLLFDDFKNKNLNTAYWTVLEREQNYNNELQAYVYDNVKVNDGNLILIAENIDGKYESGLINTQQKVEFQYGTVEVRMKYPVGKSFFPAIWLLPVDDTYYPEVDILEVLGHNPDTLYFVYHYHLHGKQKTYTTSKVADYEDFHTYRLEWTPESLTWYLDGKKVFHVTEHIPQKRMYLIINFAIGGIWPGNPDETTVFPSQVLIDYVAITPYFQAFTQPFKEISNAAY